ncbi:Sec-independent protein translocase protein TatA [bacterium HR08]|nr:Sec-independent protein translocase protein TatA [bacterium HR08]
MVSFQFSSIGLPELLLILMIALLLFGTKRLPELGSSLGRAISEFKRGLSEEAPKRALSGSPEGSVVESPEKRRDTAASP